MLSFKDNMFQKLTDFSKCPSWLRMVRITINYYVLWVAFLQWLWITIAIWCRVLEGQSNSIYNYVQSHNTWEKMNGLSWHKGYYTMVVSWDASVNSWVSEDQPLYNSRYFTIERKLYWFLAWLTAVYFSSFNITYIIV